MCFESLKSTIFYYKNKKLEYIRQFDEKLNQKGIIFRGADVDNQLLYVMGDFENDTRTHHIHVVEEGDIAFDNYINFRHDVEILDKTFENYRLALHDTINNVASITSLDEEEYFNLVNIRFEYEYELDMFRTVLSQLEDNLLGCGLLITMIADLSKQLENINEMLNTIEERLDSGDLKNLMVVDLLQIVWDKYNSDQALFSYSNLVEQSMSNKPWLVIDTISDFDEVAYISSFQSKTEALRYIMSKGLYRDSLICRY